MNGAEIPTAISDSLLRACIAGGLFTLFVGIICRVFPRLPAAIRCWLWWLACAKMMVDLLIAGFVPLPIPAPAIRLPAVPQLPVVTAPPISAPEPMVHADDREEPVAVPPSHPRPVIDSAPAAFPLALKTLLILAYAGIVAGLMMMTILRWRNIRRLLRDAAPLTQEATINAANAMAELFGVATPRLVTLAAASPFVVGAFRPTIVLPDVFVQNVPPDTLRLALAHEMAHLRRGDLWLGALPLLMRNLLFFFPLAHVAFREYEQAREEACDAAALQHCGGMTAQYGRLLVSLADGVPATLGMAAPGYPGLRRRLQAIKRGAKPGTRLARAASFALIPPMALGMVPWRISGASAVSAAPAAISFAQSPEKIQYELVDIGTLGGLYSDAYSINDAGQIAGIANIDPSQERGHAFLQAGDKLKDLSADSDYRRSVAYSVNQKGVVAAAAFQREAHPQAFIWDGKRHYLGSLPGFRYSKAISVNENGVVAGNALTGRAMFGATPARAFVYQGGVIKDVGTLGGPFSHASAINDGGVIVGKADLPRATGEVGATHAFAYEPGHGMRDLGTLPGGANSRAYAVNGLGAIVGYSETGDGVTRAFLAGGDGAMRDLGSLPGAGASVAYAINDSGQIVGAVVSGDRGNRAIVWQKTTLRGTSRPLDLNDCIAPDSGWILETARGINNRGWIVGQGRVNGRQRAFLLRPVPSFDRS